MGTDNEVSREASSESVSLTPAQRETLELIRLPSDQRITHDPALRPQLHLELEAATEDLSLIHI